MPKPRVNKTKDQIAEQLKYTQKIDRERSLCKSIWPLIDHQASIYDAQTALNALSGFITAYIQKKIDDIKVEDLALDLSKEPDNEIKQAVVEMIGLLGPENAKDTASLLERYGKTLAQYGANQYLKNPMSVLKIEDIVA